MSDQSMILSVNAGSSSLKISLYQRTRSQDRPVGLILTSSISSISTPPATFSFAFEDKSKSDKNIKKQEVDDVKDHSSAFAHFLERLEREASLKREDIRIVCHRVVHGGDYSAPVVVSKEAYHHIEQLTDLAPLHNGAALSVIHACFEHLPRAKSIAHFDTTFHRTLPAAVAAYAIDQEVAQKRGLRKYGFHGISYAYILRTVAGYLHKPEDKTSLIVLHLGSGASACAIKNGKSIDTSMGLTPLHGLPGATRSGSIDPATVFHYTNTAGRITHDKKAAVDVNVTEAEELLNKKAGWKAICGTAEFGEIVEGMDSEPAKKLAFDLFLDRILTYVGSYHLKLGGAVDALVFAGGIGEKSAELRTAVVAAAGCLGYALDETRNKRVGSEEHVVEDIGTAREGKGKQVLVCYTDEQEEMARQSVLNGD